MFGFILKYGCDVFPRFERDRYVRFYFKHEYPIFEKVYAETGLDAHRMRGRPQKHVYEVSPFFVKRVSRNRDPKLSCNYCDLQFNKRRRLDEHMNRTHE